MAFQFNTPIITIPAYNLLLTKSYMFICHVYSIDGRQTSKIITVSTSPSGSVTLTIASAPLYALETESFAIIGNIHNYEYDLNAQWSVSLAGAGGSYPVSSTTKLERQFTATDVKLGILYPISFAANTLPGGRTYLFRLTAYPTGSQLQDKQSYTEISIKIIKPPQNGVVSSYPSTGYALQTRFQFAFVWVD